MMLMIYFLASMGFLPSFNSQSLEKSRSVWVEQGLIKGKIYKIDEQQLQIFRGIPYAEPPLGKLRFKKPVKKSRWEREFSAIEYGSPCIQFMDFHKNDKFAAENMRTENENCLFLNIFSPYNSEDESQLFPILVWIHGGSFLAGSSDTGIDMETVAKNLVFKNLTLITLNYRLGPFGFMTIEYEDRVEGNFGIWDQKMALEWIQRNIKQFNGDPNKVTVMGESAGAAAVSALALSPLTKNLMHQVIIMSGSSTAGWAIHRNKPVQWEIRNIAEYILCNKVISDEDLLEILGHESFTERERKRERCNLQDTVPDCLVNGGIMNTEEMVECFRKEVNFSSPLFRRALAAELGVSKMVVDNELILDSGLDLVRNNARLPLFTGVARREWAHKKPEYYQFFRFENITRKSVEESVRKIVESAYLARIPNKVSNSTIDLITNATLLRYMHDVNFHYDMPGVVIRLQDLEADIEFVSPCDTEVRSYSQNGLPVFVYSFDYIPRGSLIEKDKRFYPMFGDNTVAISRKDKTTHGFKLDAFHGLDHAFIFTQGYSSNFYIEPFSKRDKAMSKILTKMLSNFVIKGNPSTENFTWPAYNNESEHYVSITIPPKIIRGGIHFPAPSFWNEEVAMLSRYTLVESTLNEKAVSELSIEERIQLNAYKRSWYVLWLFVGVVAILLWLLVICYAFQKSHNPTTKTYDNIILNR